MNRSLEFGSASIMRATTQAIMFVCLACLVSACATVNSHRYAEQPATLDDAINTIVTHLATRIRQDQGLSHYLGHTTVVLDPFVDTHSQEQNRTSVLLSNKITALAEKEFGMQVHPLQTQYLKQADYAIHGTIFLDTYPDTQHRYYRIYAIARSVATGRAIASVEAWVKNKDLDYTPLEEFRDTPVYSSSGDKQHETTSVYQAEAIESADYQTVLETRALLNEAGAAYAQRDYPRSLVLYKAAASQNTQQSGRIYAGLYMNYLKLNQAEQAEKAFEGLIRFNLENDKRLAVKLLFKVGSTEFIESPLLIQQYELWLRVIGTHFDGSHACLNIEGHSSHTGSADYNEGLSLRRAEAVQAALQPYIQRIMELSTAIGKGFRENIVGLGSDDARDAIDRRVEFVLRSCAS